jgi:hypothetical protein
MTCHRNPSPTDDDADDNIDDDAHIPSVIIYLKYNCYIKLVCRRNQQRLSASNSVHNEAVLVSCFEAATLSLPAYP